MDQVLITQERITRKVLKHFYFLKQRKGNHLVLECPYTSETLELNTKKDFKKNKTCFLVSEGQLMKKSEEITLRKAYALETLFLKKMGAVKYQKLHEFLKQPIFSYKNVTSKEFYVQLGISEDIVELYLKILLKYKETKIKSYQKKKLLLYFFSKEPRAVEILNNFCKENDILIAMVKDHYVFKFKSLKEKRDTTLQKIVQDYFSSLQNGDWGFSL